MTTVTISLTLAKTIAANFKYGGEITTSDIQELRQAIEAAEHGHSCKICGKAGGHFEPEKPANCECLEERWVAEGRRPACLNSNANDDNGEACTHCGHWSCCHGATP